MEYLGYRYLESLLMFGIKPGLTSTETLCKALGNPERSFRTIHVVGTNGKGSTSFYLANILQAHQKNTLLYTSPHLISLSERIRLNGIPISKKDLNACLLEVKEAAENTNIQATYFEALTVAAFLYAKKKNAEYFVAEAGLGGRFDATAVAKGDFIILTSIGLEHTAILGDTEEKILKEKLGIVKANATCLCGHLKENLITEAKRIAEESHWNLQIQNKNIPLELLNSGNHYEENANLSFALSGMILKEDFNTEKAKQILKRSLWPGRMQLLHDTSGNLKFILDGAHNSHAMKRLTETLQKKFPNKKFHTIFGVLKDKDLSEMLSLLAPNVQEFHLSGTSYERFSEPEILKAEIEKRGFKTGLAKNISKEFIRAVQEKAQGETVLITGSLYLIGACIYLLKDDFRELDFFKDLEMEANEKH